MFTNEDELKQEVRNFTGYTSTKVISTDGLNTAYRSAKRLIRRKKSLNADFDWYDSDKVAAQDALFYFTCLKAKVETGELDAQDLQTGAIDQKTLLAKDGDSVTEWYREAHDALEDMQASTIIQSTTPIRSDRDYQPDSFGEDSGGDTGDILDI